MAVIHTRAAMGMAPFAAHVHALDSALGAGDPLTTFYEWDFGDGEETYNRLVGWNAAHVYDRPGEYTVRLRLIDAARQETIRTEVIRVVPDRRPRLYVAASGDDADSGLSPDRPVRTFRRAMQRLRDGMTVVLRRGDVFDVGQTQHVAKRNWVLGAYEEGDSPVLRWSGSPGCGAIIALDPAASADVIIEDIRFDSIYAASPERNLVDAIKLAGRNITVRRCVFADVTTALNCERRPVGVLSCDNATGGARGLGAYYLWGQGSDHVHIGNTVRGSAHEHNIRLGGTVRALISHNDLTNAPKRCIWSMLGEYAYVAGNRLHEGRLTVGPNKAVGHASDRFRWCIVEGNLVEGGSPGLPAVEIEHGAEHVAVRNNIIKCAGGTCIAVSGHSVRHDRTSADVRIWHNTGVNDAGLGRFLECGPDVQQVAVLNNLYVAPGLETGTHRSAVLFVLDSDLRGFTRLEGNIWPIPAAFRWVDNGVHYLWSTWSAAEGYRNPGQWDRLPQTGRDAYMSVSLDGAYRPGFPDAWSGRVNPVAGAYADFHGAVREAGRRATAGAVEVRR